MKETYFAVRRAASWSEWRVVPLSRFQAFHWGKRQPYVFDTKRQAKAVMTRLNEEGVSDIGEGHRRGIV